MTRGRSAFRFPFKADIDSKRLIAHGAFTDVSIMKTKHDNTTDKKVYVVKEIRCLLTETVIVEIIFTALRARAPRWFLLDPDKVAPFLGLLRLENGRPAVVLHYYANGNIANFLRDHPDTDKMPLIKDSVEGIRYLHSQNINHGNVCLKNFLITNDGKVLVSDPGFHHTLRNILLPGDHSISSEWASKPREELEPTAPIDLRPSKPKDVYSLACVIFEICGGRVPDHRWPFRGIMFIINSGHIAMQRPAQINTTMWGILQLCWDRNAGTRPTIEDVDTAVQQLTSVD